MTITDRHLNSTVFTDVRALLIAQDGNYSSSSQPLITASYPDSYDFTNPIIVINETDVNQDNPSMDRDNWDNKINVLIELFTHKTKDRSMLSEDVKHFLKTPINGLSLQGVSESSTNNTVNQQKVKYKSMMFTFLRR